MADAKIGHFTESHLLHRCHKTLLRTSTRNDIKDAVSARLCLLWDKTVTMELYVTFNKN